MTASRAALRRLPGRILALTPGDLRDEDVDAFARRARTAIEAGLDSILVREPASSDRTTLALALALREALGPTGWLGVHDRVHLASAARADGVHVGFRSLSIRDARAVCGETIAIGFSAHAHDDDAARDGADYVTYGPVFATPSKQGVLESVGVDGVARAVSASRIPIWALGGIDARCARDAASTGCAGIAVRAAILGDADPARAFVALRDALGRSRSE